MSNDTTPPPSAPTSFAEAAAGIERRIAEAPVRTRPFPHLVVDDLLPAAVRRAIDRYWPAADRFGKTNHPNRGEVRVPKLAARTDGYERGFWLALQQLTVRANGAVRRRLDRHLHDKYRPLLGPDWRRRLRDVAYVDDAPVLADYSGRLYMAPHIDHARVVINGFVYLDDPEMPVPEPRRGTMLYRSLGLSWPTNAEIPEDLQKRFLREAEEVAWRDNRLLAYVNGPWSFHGVPLHDLGDSRRRLLMVNTLIDKPAAERLFDPVLR